MTANKKFIVTASAFLLLISSNAFAIGLLNYIPFNGADEAYRKGRYSDVIGNFTDAKESYRQSEFSLAKYYLAEILRFEGDDHKADELYQVFINDLFTSTLSDDEKLFLADLYYWGDKSLGIKKNRERSYEIFLSLAEKGNPTAAKSVSDFYRFGGRGVVEPSEEKSKEYYELAFKGFKKEAEAGNLNAYIELSKMFRASTLPFPRDSEESLRWLKIAVDAGHLPAIWEMVDFYSVQFSLRDEEKAFEYSQLAADMGSAYAKVDLSSRYFSGSGVNKDIEKSKSIALEALKLGNLHALEPYSQYLVVKDDDTSLAELKLMVKKYCSNTFKGWHTGFYCSHIPPGYFHEKGINTPINMKMAIDLYTENKNSGFWEGFAFYRLGKIYEYGNGVLKDFNLAISNYKLAADNYFPMAKCSIVKPLFEIGDVSEARNFAKEGFNEGYEECELVWNELELYKVK